MTEQLEEARKHFIGGLSRIAHFWGFPKAMGAIFATIYLSEKPMTLDDLVDRIGISKGAASTNVRSLERLKMVRREVVLGDRKDYWVCETDLWAIVQSVLKQREQSEFDQALRAVSESLEMLGKVENGSAADLFHKQRMEKMQRFFGQLDGLVATLVTINDLRESTLTKWFAAGRGPDLA